MKTRNGFVSNSSSSSFVIQKANLTPYQIDQIKDYEFYAEKMGLEYWDDGYWTVTETEDTIGASTIMDNFDFFEFLEKIGVKEEHIDKDSDPYDWSEWEDRDFDLLEDDDED